MNFKFKLLKKEKKKKRLEIWQIGSFPQNLAWIHAAVSEKPELTDGQRTPAPRQWLLTESSIALLESQKSKSIDCRMKWMTFLWPWEGIGVNIQRGYCSPWHIHVYVNALVYFPYIFKMLLLHILNPHWKLCPKVMSVRTKMPQWK